MDQSWSNQPDTHSHLGISKNCVITFGLFTGSLWSAFQITLTVTTQRADRQQFITKHWPEEGVGPVVVHLALRVPPVQQALLGRLPHHLGFAARARIRTADLQGAVVVLLDSGGGGTLAADATLLRLGLGHGCAHGQPASALNMTQYGWAYPKGSTPVLCHLRQPLPSILRGGGGEGKQRY